MGCGRTGTVLGQVRLLFRSGTVAGLTDGQLLERFLSRRGEESEAAFAALVARHGPMVLSVCRHLLADTHDADDVFQATFLTLALKAGALRAPDRLGPWLHGVAHKKARKLLQQRARRSRHEQKAGILQKSRSPDPAHIACQEAEAIHQEVGRLPEKYRTPVVLCYLQGHSHEVAAQLLGWPVGTVRGRLARARDRLRARLTRLGLAPAGALLGEMLAPREASAAVSAELARSTVDAAMRLATARAATLAELTRLAGTWVRTLPPAVPKCAALALLATGIAAGAWGQRDARVDLAAEMSALPAAEHKGDRSTATLPQWVSNAVKDTAPDAIIVEAQRTQPPGYLLRVEAQGGRRTLETYRTDRSTLTMPLLLGGNARFDRAADGVSPSQLPEWVSTALAEAGWSGSITRAVTVADAAYIVKADLRGKIHTLLVTGRLVDGARRVLVRTLQRKPEQVAAISQGE